MPPISKGNPGSPIGTADAWVKNRASCKACPALGLMQFVYSGWLEKAHQLGTSLSPKQTLRLVQWSIAVDYLVKAILANA